MLLIRRFHVGPVTGPRSAVLDRGLTGCPSPITGPIAFVRGQQFETVLDLRLAIDPLPPRGNFVHYDFLKLQYISHKMRHVSPLRVEALSCNNNITYVTL